MELRIVMDHQILSGNRDSLMIDLARIHAPVQAGTMAFLNNHQDQNRFCAILC